METVIIAGSILIILGILGSIIPALPGPFLSFLGVLLLFFSSEFEVSFLAVLLFGAGMVLLLFLNYLGPLIGAKYFGQASKKGVWGAAVGALMGLLFFPPLGIFIGALAGAFLFEMHSGKKADQALKSAAGVLVGSAAAIIFQVIYALGAAAYFAAKVF